MAVTVTPQVTRRARDSRAHTLVLGNHQ
jgi:hypothetical protein